MTVTTVRAPIEKVAAVYRLARATDHAQTAKQARPTAMTRVRPSRSTVGRRPIRLKAKKPATAGESCVAALSRRHRYSTMRIAMTDVPRATTAGAAAATGLLWELSAPLVAAPIRATTDTARIDTSIAVRERLRSDCEEEGASPELPATGPQ